VAKKDQHPAGDAETPVGDDAAGRAPGGGDLRRDMEDMLADLLCHADPDEQARIADALAPLIAPKIQKDRSLPARALLRLDRFLDSAFAPTRWVARIRSLFERRSARDILTDLRPGFRVETVILTERSSGALLAAGGRAAPTDDQLKSILTFGQNARHTEDDSELRRLGGEGDALFLRLSPSLLIGVTTSGPAPENIKAQLETRFARFFRRHRELDRPNAPIAADVGEDLANELAASLRDMAAEIADAARSAPWRAGAAVAVAVAGLLAVGGTLGYETWRNDRIADDMTAAAAAIPNLAGYPLNVNVDRNGIRVEGLTPSAETEAALASALQQVAEAAGRPLTLTLATPAARVQAAPSASAERTAEAVTKAVAPFADAAAANAGRLAKLEAEQTAAHAAADLQAATVAAISKDLAGLRAELAAMAAGMDALKSASDERLNTLAARQEESGAAAQAAFAEKLDARAQDIEARLTALQDAIVADRSQAISELQARIGAVEAASANTAALDRQDASLEALSKQASGFAQTLEDQAQAASALEAGLTERIEALAADIAQRSADLRAALDERTNAAETPLAALAERLNAFETDIAGRQDAMSAALAAQARTAEAPLAAMVERLNALETDVAARHDALRAALDGQMKEAEAQLAAMTERLDAVGADAAATREEMASVADASANLAVRMENLASESGRLDDRMTSAVARIQEVARAAEAEIDPSIGIRLNELGEVAETLASTSAKLEAAFANQTAEINALAANLSAVQTQVSSAVLAAAKVNGPDGAVLPAANDPALADRLDGLEARAAEAIAILDQRIDRIAQEAQPRAASPVEAAQRQLGPLRIAFASLAQPADPDAAADALKRAAEVALAMPAGMRLRIIGYADSDGTTEANRITSKRRSDWAYDQLTRLGVPAERMVSVGRGAERLLSPDASDDSPNRRVEFEAF